MNMNKKKLFSAWTRASWIKEAPRQTWDLLVIGGGITGAGIALDAQSRGIRTILVEMQDFAAGTSSRSTKLIHGGLRYLKQAEIQLVKEVGRERQIVYENAPHVTEPIWMLLPIYRDGSLGKWSTSIGLWLYDWLAQVKKEERRRMLSISETIEHEPLLKQDGLLGAGFYVEYQTDDARLTIEVIKKAVEYGSVALNYIKADRFLYEQDQVVGIEAVDVLTGQRFPIRAKVVVNATGPWVDQLREKDGSLTGKRLYWTKGVHLVFDRQRFPLQNAVYFDLPDGRMMFVIPRGEQIYAGTTDTEYHDSLEHPRTSIEDVTYLLEGINRIFPSVKLTTQDVRSFWAGVRPLVYEEGKSPSEISRKDEMFVSPSGLITIAGGKLTGYRKMAEKVTNEVVARLQSQGTKIQHPECYTDRIPLSGGEVGGSARFAEFIEDKISHASQFGISLNDLEKLVRIFGSNVDDCLQYILEGKEEAERTGLPLDLYGSLLYSLRHEMVLTAVDFFARRVRMIPFEVEKVLQWKDAILYIMYRELGWDVHMRKKNEEMLLAEFQYATQPID